MNFYAGKLLGPVACMQQDSLPKGSGGAGLCDWQSDHRLSSLYLLALGEALWHEIKNLALLAARLFITEKCYMKSLRLDMCNDRWNVSNC